MVGGPNQMAADPPCQDPDSILTTGGADENGNFIDEMGQPGISLPEELENADCIYPYDVCLDRVGPVVCAFEAAAAPLLCPAQAGACLTILMLIAWRGVRRRSGSGSGVSFPR
jgi:hypothetical protein